MLPVVPASIQSGVPPFCGAAVGHEPAAVAMPDAASVRTIAATEAASAMEQYTREDFTAVTLHPLIASLIVALRWVTGKSDVGMPASATSPQLKYIAAQRGDEYGVVYW
jgi:hypothetical protein